MRLAALAPVVLLASACFAQQQKYAGPMPEKADLPYLKHASKLIATEALDAKTEQRKDEEWAITPGASSPVRTPLAEPYFFVLAEKLDPTKLELYKVDSKIGNRELLMSRKNKAQAKPLRIFATPLGQRLYRVDVSDTLELGEYCLSPSGSNQVFCFQVF